MSELRYIFSFILACSCLTSVSQDRWLRTAGGTSQDEALTMDSRENGGYYIGGYFNSAAQFGASQLQSSGLSDGFIQAVNDNGETAWLVKLGGLASDRVVALAAHPSGGCIATGFYSQQMTAGNFTLNAGSDSTEVFVVRVDASGTVLWAKDMGGVYDDVPQDITIDGLGDIYVTGQFKSTASFGPFTATSMFYESGSQHSYDIFLVKLNSLGAFQWLQTGTSDQDNRGMSVTTNSQLEVILAAQISDTITFDQTHENEVLNSGALVAFSMSGVELWFRRFSANEVLPYDIKTTSEGNLRVIGDFIGTMAVYDTNVQLVSPSYSWNVFLMEWSSSGDYESMAIMGSDNSLSGRALVIGDSDESYITGIFKCEFTELNESAGPALYKSLGYNDIWIGKIDPSMNKIWFKQYGGPGNDFCSAIAYSGLDRPVLAGGYSRYFHVPSDDTFLDVSTPYTIVGSYPPNTGVGFCNNPNYGSWKTIKAAGSSEFSREIFLTDGLLVDQGPLDYYHRSYSQNCEYDSFAPCIGSVVEGLNSPFTCPDFIESCNPFELYLENWVGVPGIFSPDLTVLWSTSDQEYTIDVTASGVYHATVSRADGCESFTPAVDVLITGEPDIPWISDELEINVNAVYPVADIIICDDSVIIWGGNVCDGCSGSWMGTNDTITTVTQSGVYTFVVQDSLGCASNNFVEVLLETDISLDFVDVDFSLNQGGEIINADTITLCPGQYFNGQISPDIYTPQGFSPSANVDVYHDGAFFANYPISYWGFQVYPEETGLYEVIVHPEMEAANACNDTLFTWPSFSQWVYVIMLEPPVLNLDYTLNDSPLCPGDTALLVLSGADQYTVNGEMLEWLSVDSVLLTVANNYQIYGESTSADGCNAYEYEYFQLEYKPTPQANTIPSSGIVCPGDSVLLLVEPGSMYQWIGPLGQIIDVTQSVYVNTPGQYFCIHEDNEGCILESNIVETFEYSSPFISAFPGTELCFSGEVQLEVFSNDGADIWWSPPINSSAPVINISTPGTYAVSSELCGITNELSIEISASLVTAEITADDLVLCPGESAVLSAAETGLLYEWLPDGQTSSSIVIMSPGTYILSVFNDDGCSDADTLFIAGEELLMPMADDFSICQGDTVALVAYADAPIFWSDNPSGSPVIGLGDTYVILGLENEITVYAFSGDEDCYSDPFPVQVSIDPASIVPEFNLTGGTCVGLPMYIDITPSLDEAGYEWILPNGEAFNGSILTIDSLALEDAGTYSVGVIGEYCSSPILEFELEVAIPGTIEMDVLPSANLCEGDSSTMFISDSLLSSITWQTPLSSIYGSNALTITSVDLNDSGYYLVTATSENGCSVSQAVNLIVDAYPIVELDSALECQNGFLYAILSDDYDTYLWNNGSTSAQVLIDEDGWWWVEAVNGNQCATKDSVFVYDETCIGEMLNVITANGDGINDDIDFNLMGLDIKEVQIFNRWGTPVRIMRSGFIWDGRSDSGNVLSEGIYYWVVISDETSFKGIEKKGYVQLIH